MDEKRPNILLITTDQQRFDTINALGNRHIFTPHLNWLVDRGIAYNRCYTDCPVCMPARATIMTGKHAYNLGLMQNTDSVSPMKNRSTIPGLLTNNGYQTRAQGKMHFHPMRANYGFEHMELPMDYFREMNRNEQIAHPKAHGVGENEIEPVISTVHEVNSLTYWTVKRSIDFIETRDETRPFFLWTSFTKPHPPYDPCLNYWTLYGDREVDAPVHGQWSQTPEQVPKGYMKPTYYLNNAHRLTMEQMKDVKRAYYACITQIDYSLGLLFARLRELKLMENTWIIFTSDHGDMMGDHHMGAKSVFLEGSAHVPMIIVPPSDGFSTTERTGTRVDSMVDLADLMPTVLQIAGVDSPEDCDGVSLLDVEAETSNDRTFYGCCGNTYFAVIEGRHKYMWTVAGGAELLFDLYHDPKETVNLAVVDSQSGTLKHMRKKLLEYLRQHTPALVKNGRPMHDDADSASDYVGKWPGFHSTVVPTDVLH